MNWYFEDGGVSRGPHTEMEMSQMLLENRLTMDALVWRPGMEEWQTLRELNLDWLSAPAAVSQVAEPEPRSASPSIESRPAEHPVARNAPMPSAARPQAPSPEPEAEKTGLFKRLFGAKKR